MLGKPNQTIPKAQLQPIPDFDEPFSRILIDYVGPLPRTKSGNEYHPESQCALERFHQTLKNMIRSYCFDTEKYWDGGIHLLLFAVRESVQESLGFSPFELVFGHSVRGPLKLLKEDFLSNDETPLNLLQYVSDFRNRLSRACEVARSSLKTSRGKMKARYDNHVIDRKFKPGDKVLALLPIPGRPLQARFKLHN